MAVYKNTRMRRRVEDSATDKGGRICVFLGADILFSRLMQTVCPVPQAVILRPKIPATMRPMQSSRSASFASPNNMMPHTAVPTAPMPVHTA